MGLVGETFVVVKAVVDQSQVKRDLRKGLQGGFAGAFGGGAGGLLKTAGFAGLGTAVALELRKSVSAAADVEKIQTNLRNSLEATGLSWQRQKGFIDEALQSQSKLSAFDDEDLAQSLAGLVRRTGDVGEALRLNALAADIARGANVNLGAAAKAVGRASDGQTAALTRLNVQVKKGASGVEALDAASRKYAGAAEGYGDTAAGSFDKLNKTVDDLRENIGGALTPALQGAADDATSLLDPVNEIIGILNDQNAKHPGFVDGLKAIAEEAAASNNPFLRVLKTLKDLREEAEDPISPPSASLLSAGRVEDIRAGVVGTPDTPDAPKRLGEKTRLELQLRAAERRKDLVAQRKIAQELVEIATKRVEIVKTVGPLLAKRKEEEQDALDRLQAIDDEIASNAAQAAQDRADAAQKAADDAKQAAEERKRLAEERKAAEAAELRQDISDSEQALQNNLLRAQLTKKRLDDDRKALRALIAFYRAQSRNMKLEKGERLSFQRQLIQTRGELQNLGSKNDQQSSGGATVGDFFASAIANFRSFGSNVAGRGGVLSAQDERASFAFEALKRLKGGAGLAGVGAGAGAAAGASLDTVVQTQRTGAAAQVAEQKITNHLLQRLVDGFDPKHPNRKPKTPGGAGFAAGAAEGIWIAGV